MRRPIVLLATCAVAACSASSGSRVSERVEVPPPAMDTAPSHAAGRADIDLSGPWLSGSTGEPDVPRIVVRPQCNYGPALWVLEQRGDTVRAWTIPESRAQGIRAPDPVRSFPAEGRISGVKLTMSLGTSRYVLRYDSTSGHLRGTLNGAPFWAVREEIVRPQGCIPVP
ncbi:MAG: hypothetical protein ACJ8AD_18745 [Gemmatimonadaceae bacterium]